MSLRALGIAEAKPSFATIQSLVDRSEPESDELEFKQTFGDVEDLARDICAFSNARGGCIVVGIKEDGQDRAKEVMPFALGRSVTGVRQSTESRIEPKPRGIQWHDVTSDQPGLGVLVIEIPPSALRPHFVRESNSFAAFRRSGRSRRLLTEAEMEWEYRTRFEVAQTVRMAADELATRLKKVLRNGGWWSALVPASQSGRIWNVPSDATDFVRQLRHDQSLQFVPDFTPIGAQLRVRFRRIETAVQWDDESLQEFGWSTLEDTGAFGWSVPFWTHDHFKGPYLNQEFLLGSVLGVLTTYRQLCSKFELEGAFAFRVGLEVGSNTSYLYGDRASRSVDVDAQSVQAEFGGEFSRLTEPRQLMLLARDALADLMTSFGNTKGPAIDTAGRIVLGQLGGDAHQLARRWASANGVECGS